ncbi:uncharacterized protein [Dysidea avara]|uniref:uncharacterized protein n=1 Tax=Dysidea avara TaxID=196820 RepID=UPI0033307ECD
MAFRVSSSIFAHIKGCAQGLCIRRNFCCLRTTSQRHLNLSRPGVVGLNHVRAASSDTKAPNPLREYINREMEFHTEELNCSSAAELPKYKGFKLSLNNDDGTAVFERTHKNETITVEVEADIRGFASNELSSSSSDELSSSSSDSDEYDSDYPEEAGEDEFEGSEEEDDYYEDDTSDEMMPQFDVKIKKSSDEICFSCTYETAEVLNDMTEEDIYDITSIGISSSDLTVDTTDLSEGLVSLYYDYLTERGITQDFLHFLQNTFLPEYERYYYVEKVLKPLANFT